MRVLRPVLSVLMLLTLSISVLGSYNSAGVRAQGTPHIFLPLAIKYSSLQDTKRVFLPAVYNLNDFRSPLIGFETNVPRLSVGRVKANAEALSGKYVRINGVNWSTIQPTQGSAYDWSAMDNVEQDLRAAHVAHLTPLMIVHRYPTWATVQPKQCSAVKEGSFGDFATFMREVVSRYKNPPYNVHDWEIGNEPDVDPSLVASDSPFGCWGDQNGVYYGGKHYGEMLNAIAPAIRSADPGARIYVGGLLLDDPTPCTFKTPSKPSCFLDGILTANATGSFDVIAYHAYASAGDPDKLTKARQKAQYLKEVMARYGVSKPIMLTETALRCPLILAPVRCTIPDAGFYDEQADFVPRVIVRSLADGVESVLWYTLDGSGWDNSGLLDASQQPRPAYYALQTLALQTAGATAAPTNIGDAYGAAFEAYRFQLPNKIVDVVWSKDEGAIAIGTPAGFLKAVDRDGAPLAAGALTSATGTIYVQRTR